MKAGIDGGFRHYREYDLWLHEMRIALNLRFVVAAFVAIAFEPLCNLQGFYSEHAPDAIPFRLTLYASFYRTLR